MTHYSTEDAIRELAIALDKAPSGAATGKWTATTMQAGHSSRSGGYRDAGGNYLSKDTADPAEVIDAVVEKLEASGNSRFNQAVIRWKRSWIPFTKGQVTIETVFDETIVPRGPDDPIYESAAKARREFWARRGAVDEGFAAERNTANIHNQTKWFGPHRRILAVRHSEGVALATDGLSTPWAGISERENGVECELFMDVAAPADADRIDELANLLIGIGDLVADGYRVARDVQTQGAILFCRLSEDYRPLARIVLSREPASIDGLPFGSVPLIRATAITEAEIADFDLSDEWGATAARGALEARGIEVA